MAKIPTPRSWNQIVGDMVAAFLSRFGLKSLKIGSPILSMIEAAAQSDLRSSQDIFDLLNSIALDRAERGALDRIGADEGVPRGAESASSGNVTVKDSRYTKLSSRVYQGLAAPIAGSNVINVSDASAFPASGSVYLGRGTSNYEGPLAYSSKTDNGTYWSLTLTGTTQRFHNLGESVIVAQGGNRLIPAGSLVQTPQGNVIDAVQFSTLFAVTLPDGEVEISGITVVAQKPGIGSNVPAGAIQSFVTAPFSGASVTNPLPFSNGLAADDDKTYREKIRKARQSRAKGTALAIVTAVQGIVAKDENKRVTSASVVAREGFPTTLYIDDGTGYEEISEGVAVEPLVDSALGGEQYFQIAAARPVSKAFVITTNVAPFQLEAASILAVKVGGIAYEHSFDPADFRSVINATAYEVAASINSNPLLAFSAATVEAGTKVRLFAKADTGEDIEVATPSVGTDANAALLFPVGRVDTMRLYKNDRLLSKDGVIASVVSKPPAVWGSFSSGETLQLAVDGTSTVTYTFVDQDFIDAKTGYTTVGRNSLAAWAAVLNAKIPGITATVANGLLEVVSNVGRKLRAQLNVVGGSLVSPGQMFAAQVAVGADSDYTLDRNTGQIRLEVPLAEGDSLTAGTENTRAFVQSSALAPTTILAPGGSLWFATDGNAAIISTGLSSATVLNTTVGSLRNWGARIRITAGASVFANVRTGDWLIAWDSALNASMKGTWRIAQATNTYVEIERKCMVAGRTNFTATTLANSKILVTGGGAGGVALASCELYDPATTTWTATGPMAAARYNHAAILLANGKVLVVGGADTSTGSVDAQTLASCELYDPALGTWSPAAALPTGAQRQQMFAARLTNPAETVVVAGGWKTVSSVLTIQSTTYKYDPAGNSWSAGAAMGTPRYDGAGLTQTNARMLTIGGVSVGATISNVTEYYDLTADTWTPQGNLTTRRRGVRAQLLSGGLVFTAGGYTVGNVKTDAAETFAAGTWTARPSMALPRGDHDLVELTGPNKVLVVGGNASGSAELYDIATPGWAAAAAPVVGRSSVTLIGLSATTALAISGQAVDGSGHQANSEVYSSGGNTWTATDGATLQTNFSLASVGMIFVRSEAPIQKVTVSAGTNNTASTFVAALNSQLVGASAATFHTNALRVNTKTFELGGDIALVSVDPEGSKLKIAPDDAVENVSNHLASVLSGNGQAGTPEFTLSEVVNPTAANKLTILTKLLEAKANSFIVGLKDYDDQYDSGSPIYRSGHNRTFSSALQEVASSFESQDLVLRSQGYEWLFRDRFYLASALALGPQDDITVVIDQDSSSKRFTVPLYRKLVPVGNTYGSQNTFRDADNGGLSLTQAFALGYDFNDFAVYMASRAKTYTGDSTKTLLWRFTKLGPDGDTARVRLTYADAPNSSLRVSTDITTSKWTSISVQLPTGGLKTGYALRNTTKVGTVAATGPGGLKILSYVLGYSVASATRTQRLNFVGQTVNFTAGEIITGGTSGVTATIVSVISDAGATGVLQITGSSGTFNPAEALTGGLGGNGTTSGSQYYNVALTLTLPTTGGGALADITNHGFNVADGLYLNSSNVNFPSGLKTVTAVTASTVSFTDAVTTETTQAGIGTLSFDPAGEASYVGATPTPIALSDMFRVETTSALPSAFENITLRISYYANQVIQGYTDAYSGGTSGTPTWTTVSDAASVKVYGLNTGSATAAAIATAVQALASADENTCPVTAKPTGNGAGIVDKGTLDDTLTASSWVYLTDGVNFVKTTTSPGSLAGDYQLTFKNGINSGLTTNSDWANEDVRLVPLTTKNLAAWLNTLTVTGLSTVADIEAGEQAQKLQIASLTAGSAGSVQVQGGAGNSGAAPVSGSTLLVTDPDTTTYAVATVKRADTNGFFAGMWTQIQNEIQMPKTVFVAGSSMTSWTTSGVLTLDSAAVTPVWTYSNSGPITSKIWQIEKQGKYVCYSFNARYPGASLPDLTGVSEGDWVRITAPAVLSAGIEVASVNTGIFRVIRVETGANGSSAGFWIENSNVLEQTPEMDIAFFTFDSLMPGDVLSVSTDLWGTANKGQWVVETVGQVGGTGPQFVNSAGGEHTFKVVTTDRSVVPMGAVGPLGSSQAPLVQVVEAQAGKFIKRIRAMVPNQVDGSFMDIKFESSAGFGLISSTAGSVISPLDKLAFSTDLALGIDGYAHTTGLIAEADKVLYSDARDPATYPGVVAAGSKVNISGPLVKRITIALAIRIRSGTAGSITPTDVADRVKSAVASVVNKTGIGSPIALSDIVTAAGRVNGVVAVSVVSPTFSAESDLISVQPYEKPLVLNLDTDILVSFVGD